MTDWARVLGRLPSGLFVVTAGTGATATALLASWVQQCSFDPPMVTLAVQPKRDIASRLEPGQLLVIHPIAEGQTEWIGHFGRGAEPGRSPFDGMAVDDSGGVTVLLDAMGHMAGRVTQRVSAGDHDLILVRIENGRLHREDAKPFVHVRKSGLKY